MVNILKQKPKQQLSGREVTLELKGTQYCDMMANNHKLQNVKSCRNITETHMTSECLYLETHTHIRYLLAALKLRYSGFVGGRTAYVVCCMAV